MSTPTNENIATVINGFEEFYNRMVKAQSFNLQEFVNFMEPRFTEAGYRAISQRTGGNILILTETGIGDFILSTGAIRETRRLYPNAHITLLVHSAPFVLAETCPYVDEVVIDKQGFGSINLFEFYKLTLQTAAQLLEQRFDICFACALHAKTFLLMYMSGAKIRVTSIELENFDAVNRSDRLSDHLMRLATHLFPRNTYGWNIADRFFSSLEGMLHLPIANRKLELWYTPAETAMAKSMLKEASAPIYALSMGGSGQKKHYTPEKYARLLKLILREESTATFVILGGGQEDLKSAAIIKDVAPKLYENNVIDLTDKISYRQSAAVLSFCNMYIGNDTGTMHAAVAVNIPVLSVICFPFDLPVMATDIPINFFPYAVPAVVVQPEHALPECRRYDFHDFYGCTINAPHCITQIEPETLFKGFHLLKARVAEKICEPLYIC